MASVAPLWTDARTSFELEPGVEGGIGATFTSAYNSLVRESVRTSTNLSTQSSLIDQDELIEAAQQEHYEREEAARQGRPYKPSHRLYIPKRRRELERLEEELEAAREGGAKEDFRTQITRLVERYHINMPSITVEYSGVTVETDALVGSAGIPTVGNSFINLAKSLVGIKPHTERHQILKDITGVLVPGRLTLLLGPPSSGKSTFLKVLAGRYQNGNPKSLRVNGSIKYNGYTFDQFEVNRTSAYISQHDNHIPLLTVLETLQFAYVMQQGFAPPAFNLMAELRAAVEKRKVEASTQSQLRLASRLNNGQSVSQAVDGATEDVGARKDGAVLVPARWTDEDGFMLDDGRPSLHDADNYEINLEDELVKLGEKVYLSGVKVMLLMRALGISHTRDTPVGDALLRGVSGGERKRVTVAEMMVGPRNALFADEISTGLDSATLFSIIRQMKQYTHGMRATMMISLLQPPPEVYNLFDDLCLMADGRVVYHGPVQGAMDFFRALGFVCPPRKDVPSFLQEVTTPAGQLEYAHPDLLRQRGVDKEAALAAGAPQFLVPTEEMVQRFWETQAGQDMKALLSKPFDPASSHPAALVHTKYALTPVQMLAVVTRRQWMLVLKDPVLIKGRLTQITIIGLLVGGLFFQRDHSLGASRQYFGALFLAVMFIAMGAMPQMAITMQHKSVWYKYRDNQFYPGWVHAFGSALAQVPVAFLDSVAWSVVTYFMWGLYTQAGYFFTYLLINFATANCCGALFRLIAHASPDGVAANSVGGLVLLILIVMSGFTIVRGSIPPWWIWAYYISPFAWALRAQVINEFTSPAWNFPSPTDPTTTLGIQSLQSFDFFTSRSWIWAGVGFLFGASILFTCISGWVLQRVTPQQVARIADKEALEQARKEAARRRAEAAQKEQAASAAAQKATPPAPLVVQLSQQPPNSSDPPASSTFNRLSLQKTASRELALAATPSQVLHESTVIVVRSSLPAPSVSLVFRDLRYFVPNPSAGKKSAGKDVPARLELLKGITGYAEPGQLTALMGGSGAGKTTLMDCIAGRKTVGEITGDILVNGHPKDQKTWARVVGYCEQMDIHTPATTVIESLLFSARLRLPNSVPYDQVRAYVEEVMEVVDLTPQQFDLVGMPGVNGLSVEQRKRLTIGVELVANPAVVFMDEPTSGLDARAAAIVMRAVRNVARNGRAVLVTIHQPSIEIFEAFDYLLLLQRGGRTTYFGPLGRHSSELVTYLQAVPGVEPITPGYNPATWMLEVTGGAVSVGAKAVDVDWPELYKSSPLCAANLAKANEIAARDSKAHPPLTVEGGRYAAPFSVQFRWLFRKYIMAYWRTPSYNFTRYIVTILVAILYGSIFYNAADFSYPATLASVQNVMGVIYSSTSFLGMTNMMAAMPIVGLERVVFYREQGSSMYDAWAFGLVASSVELPYILVQVIIYVCIFYPMMHYTRTAGHFFWYLLMTLQSISFYTSFGMALVYITPSQQLAQVVAAGLNFLFNIFNGFVITVNDMARGFVWLNRISPTTWILYGLAADQLGDNEGAFVYPQNPAINTVSGFLSSVFGYNYSFHWWCALIMVAYILTLRVLSVLALRYVSFLKR